MKLVQTRGDQERIVSYTLDYFAQGNRSIVNVTKIGLGKSYMTIATAQRMGLPLFIICAKSMIHKWSVTCKEYNVPCLEIITYNSLAGNNDQLNHDWLIRSSKISTSDKGRNTKNINYIVTPAFQQLANQGMILVIDEVHSIKNVNMTSRACLRLANAVTLNEQSRSYFIGLSATPFDDPAKAITLMKLMGLIRSDKSDKLYHYDSTGVVQDGIKNLFQKCMQVDPVATQLITSRTINKRTIKEIAYDLYGIIKRVAIVGIFKMSEETIRAATTHCHNVFLHIHPDFASHLQNAINKLMESSKYEDGKVNHKGKALDQINRSLIEIELAKTYDIALRAYQKLIGNTNSKVVICLNYNESIRRVYNYLLQFNPLIINGEVDIAVRNQYIDAFNAPNLQYRVIIMNTKAGGTGIDLHDIYGNFPRYMYLSPSYSAINLIQASGRCVREGMMSDAYIYVVYGDGNFQIEMKILEALARKSDCVRKSICEEAGDDVIYPGEYSCYRELENYELVPTSNPIQGMFTESDSESDDEINAIENLMNKMIIKRNSPVFNLTENIKSIITALPVNVDLNMDLLKL
jgi:superfamily II DNA or RNA helicase